MKSSILSFRKTFFSHIREVKNVDKAGIDAAFGLVNNITDTFNKYVKEQLDLTANTAFKTKYLEEYNSLGVKTEDGKEYFASEFFKTISVFQDAFKLTSKEMIRTEFDVLFTKANAESMKYRRYTGMSTDPTDMIKDSTVPYSDWMSKLPNDTRVTTMNIPGSYNSLGKIDDSLYLGYGGVKLLYET